MIRSDFRPCSPALAEYHADGDRWTLVFSRDLRHPPEQVWTALTAADQLGEWAPFNASRDLDSPGEATLTMECGFISSPCTWPTTFRGPLP